jgi:prolyl-tRNA synthetase
MLYSRALIRTVKEAPADAANASHTLLMRGGYIRKVGAGLYDYLPLGLRVLKKIENIVREEMDRSGAQEILMPALLPAELFKETGRYELYGPTLFRVKDRKGAEMHLGPTHEEIVTDIARREIRSFRDMPMNLYQIQSKYRDEPRPRGGLLRCREFLMKDAYSFDIDETTAMASYDKMEATYRRIFDRLGLKYRLVAADPGAIGGKKSAEFQVLADSGEDAIVACDKCDYAANVEIATVKTFPKKDGDTEEAKPREKVHTPNVGSIEAVAKFLGQSKRKFLKSLVYTAGKDVVLAIVRGDHDVNEIRLARALGVDEVHMATDADVKKATNADVGFAGPVGFTGKIIVDRTAAMVVNAATGANETDHHFTNVNMDRDWQGDIHDIRLAAEGDGCPNCDGGKLKAYKGIEGGHIFLLGTKYTEAMGAQYSDDKQEKKTIVMGCYGIGVSRLVASSIEQNNDENGIKWPVAIAPFQVHLVTIGLDEPVQSAAKKLYDDLRAGGIDVLWDDRDERPGVKFKDADLLGMPFRVTVGAKALANGNVEMKPRTEADPKKAELIPVADVARVLIERIKAHIDA